VSKNEATGMRSQ